MITYIFFAVLTVLVGMAVKAFALPIAKHIVTGWVRLYTAIVPELGKARRAEVLAHIHDQISSSLAEGYRPAEIALQILLCWVTGFLDDVLWCLPSVPLMLANKVAILSESLRNFRTPKLVIPSLAIFGIVNLAFFKSDSDRTLVTWLGLNFWTIAMILLMSKQQHTWARRVLYALFGVGGVTMLGFMAWLVDHSELWLIEPPIFWGFLLGITAIGLAILAADKFIRTRLFKGHWGYVVTCWLLIIVVSLAASMAITGDVTPVLLVLAMATLIVASLFIFCGIMTLMAAAVWYGCLRGIMVGLRVVEASLRRL